MARALREIGQRLRLKGGSPLQARAYSRVAAALESASYDLGELVEAGRLQEIRGVGPGLARVIEELHRTGSSQLLASLQAEMPPGVLELARIRWLGLRRIQSLHDKYGIDSLAALESACRRGQVRNARRFGPNTEARLLDEIRRLREKEGRLEPRSEEVTAGRA